MARAWLRLARNASWLLLGEAAAKLGLLAAALVVARGLGAVALGTFTLGYSFALLAVVGASLGQVETLIRETARRPQAARGLLDGALRLQTRLGLPLAALALLVAAALDDPSLAACFATFLPYAVLRSRLATLAAPFKGRDRMEVEVKARAVEVAVTLTLLAVAVAAGLPVWTLGLAFAAGAGAGLAALAPKLPELGAATEPAAARELLAEGWPFLGLALAMQLLFRLDLFLLAALGRSREEIGFYGAAATVVWGLLTLPQLFALAVYPTLSRSALGPSRPRRQALASAALGGGLGTMLAAGLWLAREPLVALAFGPGFAPAAPLLATLAWALPGACAAMLLGTVLAAWRGQRLALALQGAAVAASLAGNLGSIPGQGALGAAGTAVLVHGGLGLGLLAALLALRTGGPAPPPSPAPPPAGP